LDPIPHGLDQRACGLGRGSPGKLSPVAAEGTWVSARVESRTKWGWEGDGSPVGIEEEPALDGALQTSYLVTLNGIECVPAGGMSVVMSSQ